MPPLPNLPHHPFAHPLLLWAMALLPALAALAVWARRRRRLALARVGSLGTLEASVARRRRPRLRGPSLLFGMTALALGMAGPQWGRDWRQSAAPGRDLVVVLDCSRSMLAQSPTRLERAKAALLDLAETMQRHGGHRVALVEFAGRARLACPLTHDYDHFRDTIRAIDATAFDPELGVGPEEKSGTRIGLGLKQGVEAHDPRFPGARDILLLSDGDDPARDLEWREGITAARREGIPVYVVGLGDPDTPHPVPGADGKPLEYQGREVTTRLEEAPLREIARQTDGEYVPAHDQALPLGRKYLSLVAARPLREESPDALPVYRQRYPWFLGAAFAFLILALALPERLRRGLRYDDRFLLPPALPETEAKTS
jgi:Ca-activated chloride channel family protein